MPNLDQMVIPHVCREDIRNTVHDLMNHSMNGACLSLPSRSRQGR